MYIEDNSLYANLYGLCSVKKKQNKNKNKNKKQKTKKTSYDAKMQTLKGKRQSID